MNQQIEHDTAPAPLSKPDPRRELEPQADLGYEGEPGRESNQETPVIYKGFIHLQFTLLIPKLREKIVAMLERFRGSQS